MPARRFFQIRLSTAVVLMLVAGVLVWVIFMDSIAKGLFMALGLTIFGISIFAAKLISRRLLGTKKASVDFMQGTTGVVFLGLLGGAELALRIWRPEDFPFPRKVVVGTLSATVICGIAAWWAYRRDNKGDQLEG